MARQVATGPELLVMMPEAKAIGSVAMSMLGQDGSLGVMLFSSRDVNQQFRTIEWPKIVLRLPQTLNTQRFKGLTA